MADMSKAERIAILEKQLKAEDIKPNLALRISKEISRLRGENLRIGGVSRGGQVSQKSDWDDYTPEQKRNIAYLDEIRAIATFFWTNATPEEKAEVDALKTPRLDEVLRRGREMIAKGKGEAV